MCCRLADTHWASATQQPALCPAGSKIDGCSCVYLSDVNSDHGQPTSQRICCAMFESYRKKNNRQQPCWHESNGTFVLCTENWTYILQTRSVYDQCPTWMYTPCPALNSKKQDSTAISSRCHPYIYEAWCACSCRRERRRKRERLWCSHAVYGTNWGITIITNIPKAHWSLLYPITPLPFPFPLLSFPLVLQTFKTGCCFSSCYWISDAGDR